MDQQLADIGDQLHRKDPAIGAPDATPRRLQQGDVHLRVAIVAVEGFVPAVIDPGALAKKYRAEKVQFENMGADAKEIEKTVAPRLGRKKHGHQQADQHQRQR